MAGATKELDQKDATLRQVRTRLVAIMNRQNSGTATSRVWFHAIKLEFKDKIIEYQPSPQVNARLSCFCSGLGVFMSARDFRACCK